MSWAVVGHCPHCGAPIYVQSPWMSILPPPNQYSCSCVPKPRVKVQTSTGGSTDVSMPELW